MKTFRKLVLMGMLVAASAALFAQGPPDPNGGNDPGTDNDPVGGRATVSGGMILLLAFGAAYGGKKIYFLSRKKNSVSK